MNFLYLAVGIILGALISALIIKSQKSKLEAKSEILETNLSKNEQELTEERERSTGFQSELTKQETINMNLQEKLENQKKEIEELQKRFTDAFKNLANEILEEKTKKFTEQNRSNLDELLNP